MKPGPKPKPLAERFWNRVDIRAPNECWLFLGYIHPKSGYGMLRINEPRMVEFAHRIAWTLAYGPIPKDAHVLHSCDVRACCNPGHFFLGDQAANAADASNKGRWIGVNGKLSYEEVMRIRELLSEGQAQRVIAEQFGVCQQNISWIARYKTWRAEPVIVRTPKPR